MIYYAIAKRAPRLARLTDDDPTIQKVLTKLATGVTLWAKATGSDVERAGIDWYGKNGNAFVVALERRGDARIYQNALATHGELRTRFYGENELAIGAAQAVAQWTLNYIARDERRIPLENLEVRPFWAMSGHITVTLRDLFDDDWMTKAPTATVTEAVHVDCPVCGNVEALRWRCGACETTGRVSPGKAKRLRFLAA